MKILVLGSSGKVGHALCSLLGQQQITCLGTERSELNLTEPEQMKAVINDFQPTIVVNAASYNNPTEAENVPSLCYAINRDGVAKLADYCHEQGIPLIQVSTYRVFDGKSADAYNEQDSPNPSGVQAISRWQAEEQVRERCQQHIILRLSWIISARRNNLLVRLFKQLSAHKEVTVTADQLGCPTPADDAARVILAIIKQLDCGANVWGTYHYAAAEAVSENSFAESAISEAAQHHHLELGDLKMDKMINREGVRPPANASLDCSKIRNTFGIHRRPWRTALSGIIKTYFDNNP
ncbi:SDR family oxidoreductase [Candidatus Sororendozoicomonas aggregata]|uniref:SDR family oxidoreductase n=1 Tax=Candidatus Sororendozoicomonas aggregata TaxID=3073239 RepID=UPI002ED59E41